MTNPPGATVIGYEVIGETAIPGDVLGFAADPAWPGFAVPGLPALPAWEDPPPPPPPEPPTLNNERPFGWNPPPAPLPPLPPPEPPAPPPPPPPTGEGNPVDPPGFPG